MRDVPGASRRSRGMPGRGGRGRRSHGGIDRGAKFDAPGVPADCAAFPAKTKWQRGVRQNSSSSCRSTRPKLRPRRSAALAE